ncbi:Transcription initiation factor TFIID subunit 5 [Ascosphaera pollenicola]|nr:Transcription initiation factor TFIID subunit 5 [Ascosphaera pollenicola]
MSGLFRASAKARMGQHPPRMAPLSEASEQAGEDANASSEAQHELEAEECLSESSVSSAGTIRAGSIPNIFARPSRHMSKHDGLKPLSWMEFFDQELYLEEDYQGQHINHHVYLTAPRGSAPLFVTHHGAGSSGLTFAAIALELKKILPDAGILSLDCRDHGETTVVNADGSRPGLDLCLDTLSRDLISVVKLTQQRMYWDDLPDIVLVGHSLGGAVVTDVAKKGELGQSVLAYTVLDVVEGSAMEALQSMGAYLATRPADFSSVESAIQWHTRSRTIRNVISARVCVPSLIYHDGSNDEHPWKWRTDLRATKPFWENWFNGLSKKFLEARGGKLLLLAGTDRLDKELIIGQMQESGHFIQEDQPAKTAQVLADFYKRNDRSALVLPPKVGDIMASRAISSSLDASQKQRSERDGSPFSQTKSQ